MQKPAISVIIPVYNMEKYIVRCLKSLLTQQCDFPYEIIVVDDGSNDQSMKLIDKHFHHHPYLRIIHQSNQGVSYARNMGLKHAKGEYISFVDSDDYVESNYLQVLYLKAIKSGSDIVCCNYYNNYENGQQLKCIFKMQEKTMGNKQALHYLLRDTKVRSYLWNKLYKKSLFENDGCCFNNRNYFEDFELMPKLFYYAHKISFVDEYLYHYVQRKGSLMHQKNYQKSKDYLHAFYYVVEWLKTNHIYEEYHKDCYLLATKIYMSLYMMKPITISKKEIQQQKAIICYLKAILSND